MKKREQPIVFPGLLLICLVVFLACSGLEPTSTSPEEPRKAATSDSSGAEARDSSHQLAKILDQRLEKGSSLEDLFIEAECYEEADNSHFLAMQVHGDGLAVWDGEVQFNVNDAEIRQMLEAFQKVEFTTLRDLYGSSAMRIICRVVLEIDGVRKQVAQRRRGEQNATLKTLANDLFDIGREPAHSGSSVSSLVDGLNKIARGEINPRLMSVMVHRKPERTSDMVGENVGFLFRLAGLRATTRIYRDSTLGDPRILDLSEARILELASLLADENVVDLPQNLYADKYTDLVVRALKYETRLQARQFAGMTATTHGESQERFDRLLTAVSDLHHRTAEEGTSSNR